MMDILTFNLAAILLNPDSESGHLHIKYSINLQVNFLGMARFDSYIGERILSN